MRHLLILLVAMNFGVASASVTERGGGDTGYKAGGSDTGYKVYITKLQACSC